ncbi:MAG: hypothetical protein AAFQ54_14595 [Pseudomonadota bacterium]
MRPLFAAFLLLWPLSAWAQDVQLLMVEEDGCYWCARWNAEVGDTYPKTDKGRAAPLLRADIRAPLPDGVTLDGRLVYTPTFVLLVDGIEHGRIEGYPGDEFFWGLLGMLMDEADISLDPAS